MSAVISQTDFAGLKLRARGKVRDIYELGDQLLIVATDRLSAFDVVLPTPIPDKGPVLTQLSLFWFEKLARVVPNHVISADNFAGVLAPYADALQGRAMLVRRTEPVPIECVVRGYLSGSGWKDYQKTGSVCGIALPAGLRESDRLPEPIFTPSTKATSGHDVNISFEEMCKLVTAYSAAEIKWVKFAEGNMTKCGIPKEIVTQLKTVHAKTAEGQKKLCAAGPAGGPSAVPTLSDALGTATLPTREPEKKRKPGGTLDTLTGNALGQ